MGTTHKYPEDDPFASASAEDPKTSRQSEPSGSASSSIRSVDVLTELLLQQGNQAEIEDLFSRDTDQYRIMTCLKRNNRDWIYTVEVYRHSDKIEDDATEELMPKEKRINAKVDDEEGSEWRKFVREAAKVHQTKCLAVKPFIDDPIGPPPPPWWKKLIKISLIALFVVSLLLNVAGGYFYQFDRPALARFLGIDSNSLPAQLPELKIKCVAKRANNTIELSNNANAAALELKKDDMLEIYVIDEDGQPDPFVQGTIQLKFREQ